MGRYFQPHWGKIMPATVVESVRRKTDPQCHAATCREGKCSLSLREVPEPNVLISLEHEAAPVETNKPRCDYLFVADNDEDDRPWVAPIELTGSKADFSKFWPQLDAGAAIADQLLPQQLMAVRFRPIAVHNGIHRNEVNKFRDSRNKVRFRDRTVSIELTRCGSLLTKALNG